MWVLIPLFRSSNRLKKEWQEINMLIPPNLTKFFRKKLKDVLVDAPESKCLLFSVPNFPTKPYIILVVGVNGVGKTTTIGKLAYNFKKAGKSVLLGAADTFRAAAVDQLTIWSERAGVPIVKQGYGLRSCFCGF